MDDLNLIIKTFETQTKQQARSIHKYENVLNNRVYRVQTDSRPYIFKVYTNINWPEDGKLPFVSRKLDEINVPHAKIVVFSRDDDHFPNGYLIEECLPGTTADKLALSTGEISEIYRKLAAIMSRVHRIKLIKYGYTGDGSPAIWSTFSECMYDILHDETSRDLIDDDELEAIGREIRQRLEVCDKFPSVLCHGDLSAKNILVNANEITLIDWDDAQSLCWMADIARLTLWMKLEYDDAETYRYAFLENYQTEYGKDIFYELEETLHVWFGLGYLSYFHGRSQERYEKMKAIMRKLLPHCGMKVLKCL